MHLLSVRTLGLKLLPALFAAGAMALPAAVGAQAGQTSEAQTDGTAAQNASGASTGDRSADTQADPRQPATAGNNPAAAAPNDTSAAPSQSAAAPTRAPDLTTPNSQAHYFSDVDYSNDYRLAWEEIVTAYEPELREGGWTRTEFIDEFDTDGDEFLDEDEYSEFLAEVGLEEPQNTSSFIDID